MANCKSNRENNCNFRVFRSGLFSAAKNTFKLKVKVYFSSHLADRLAHYGL